MRFKSWVLLFCIACGAWLAAAAGAQNFPERPVTLIVPWSPGGGTDVAMRALAETTSKHLGQRVIVENRPGAAGTIGPGWIAKNGKPDGYVVSQMPITVFRLPHMTKTDFDPLNDSPGSSILPATRSVWWYEPIRRGRRGRSSSLMREPTLAS